MGDTTSAADGGALRFSDAGCTTGVMVTEVGVAAAAGVDAEAPGVEPDACAAFWFVAALLGFGVPFTTLASFCRGGMRPGCVSGGAAVG